MKTPILHPSFSNAISAEAYTRQMCAEHFNVLNFGMRRLHPHEQARLNSVYKAGKSEWCKDFFAANYPRFLTCRIGRVLMGEIPEDNSAYCHRTAAF